MSELSQGGRLAVVVVAYRSESWLPRCLESIAAAGDDIACLLVDNGGMEAATVDALRRHCPRMRLLPSAGNLGYGGGNNLAIATALEEGFEIIGLVNPDTWFEPGWATALREAFARCPEHGILGPLQLTYDEGCTLAEWTCRVLRVQGPSDLDAQATAIDTPWVEGSALFARRQVLERVGVFDPLFAMYYEELDLCRRARRAGWRIGVVPAARYHHAGGVTVGGRDSPERAVRKDLGQLLYLLTDPAHGLGRNRIEALRMVARRGRSWLRGQYPAFGRLLREGGVLAWRKRHGIRAKWRRDREGVGAP